jgi:hypothetical protein
MHACALDLSRLPRAAKYAVGGFAPLVRLNQLYRELTVGTRSVLGTIARNVHTTSENHHDWYCVLGVMTESSVMTRADIVHCSRCSFSAKI